MSVPRLSFPPPRSSPTPSLAPAVIAGALAALVGAGVWTGIVVITTYEVGWVAWGIGGLVGFVMSKFTPERSVKAGIFAAALAVVGLAIGKVATVRMLVPDVGRDLVLENGEILTQAFAADMRTGERYSPEVSIQLAALSPSDSLPDALWTKMLDEAQLRMANSSEAEKERVAQSFASGILADVDLAEQFRSSLSLFDLLWFGLAIATAFKLMRGG